MARMAIHPGEALAQNRAALGMSAAEPGRWIHVPTKRITQIRKSRRAVTGDTALRLGHFFGTSAEFWHNLKKLYELRHAQDKAGTTIKALSTLPACGNARSATGSTSSARTRQRVGSLTGKPS